MTLALATMDEVKAEIQTSKTVDDDIILKDLFWASARVANKVAKKGTSVEPLLQKRYYEAQHNNTLLLNGSLLELKSLTTGGGTHTPQLSDLQFQPWATPYRSITLVGNHPNTFAGYTSSRLQANLVDGIWGWHQDYANAWPYATAVFATVYPGNPNITVFDGTALSVGQLIRINAEYMRVLRITGNDILVQRGLQGTTEATLTEGVEIFRYQPDDIITRAVVRLTGLLYQRRGAFNQTTFDGTTTTTYPADLPTEVVNILAEIPFFHGWKKV